MSRFEQSSGYIAVVADKNGTFIIGIFIDVHNSLQKQHYSLRKVMCGIVSETFTNCTVTNCMQIRHIYLICRCVPRHAMHQPSNTSLRRKAT